MTREHRQPRTGNVEVHATDQPQVVIDDLRHNWLARYVDDARCREPQQHEKAEEAFLVASCTRELRELLVVERHARDHDDGSRRRWIWEHAPEHRCKPALQLGEGAEFLGGAWSEVAGSP